MRGRHETEQHAAALLAASLPQQFVEPLALGLGVADQRHETRAEGGCEFVEIGEADVGFAGLQAHDHPAAQARRLRERELAHSRLLAKTTQVAGNVREHAGAFGLTVQFIAHIVMRSILRILNHPLFHRMIFLNRKEWALVVVTMFWGATFLIVRLAMQHSGPLFFVSVRFLVAGLITSWVFRKSMVGLAWAEIRAGIAIGSAVFLGYSLQTAGLQTITASKSAFITAMYVPAVPLLQWLVLRRPPHPMSWVGIACAFFGVMLLSGPGPMASFGIGAGELLTMAGALAIASEIILIGRYAAKVNTQRVTAVQLLAAGCFSLLAMPLAGEPVPAFHWVWFTAALGMGCASAVIQLIMNWAQRSVSPTRATLIYTGEPIWGGVAGRLAGERLPALAFVGAALVVLGVLVSEWRPGRRAARKAPAVKT